MIPSLQWPLVYRGPLFAVISCFTVAPCLQWSLALQWPLVCSGLLLCSDPFFTVPAWLRPAWLRPAWMRPAWMRLAFSAGLWCATLDWMARHITERPHAPSGVPAFMSAHNQTPYSTPSVDFRSGNGVVWGRRGQQLECTLDVEPDPATHTCTPLPDPAIAAPYTCMRIPAPHCTYRKL